jgi:DNA-binding LacI/PurR family transcriptional regulator
MAMSDTNPPHRITLREIARELGVSHTAVSLALRNRSGISEAQRSRITAKAAEMGYVPDPMLSALSNYRLRNQESPVQAALAWINPWDKPEQLRSYQEFDLYWQGASKTARKLGYHLEEFAIKNIPVQRLEQVLTARNIQGLLIPPGRNIDIHWDGFDWSHFSIVRLGRTNQEPHVHFVTSAQLQNARMAFAEINKRGYKRIGFVGEQDWDDTFGAGFLWAQQMLPVCRRLPSLLFKDLQQTDRKATLAKWVEKHKPDAIFSVDSELPQLLTSLGYRVPEDIALAASSIIDTPIDAGIDQNSEEIGRSAVLALISLIHDSSRGIPPIQHEYLIKGRWVDGAMMPSRY